MAFDILSMLNASSLAEAAPASEYKDICLDYKEIGITKHNKYSMDDLQELATGITISGGLQEPLVLGRVDGRYWLLSGHRRLAAITILVEEGKEKYRKVPCRYKDMSETQLRIELLCGNTFNRKLTDYDLMMQAEEWKEVLKQAKAEGLLILEQGERIRDYVAAILGESTGKIGQLNAINQKADETIKEKLQRGTIGITAAYEASKLPKEKQKEVARKIEENPEIRSEEIQKLAQEQRESRKNVSESDTKEPGQAEEEKEQPPEWSTRDKAVYLIRELGLLASWINEDEVMVLQDILLSAEERKKG